MPSRKCEIYTKTYIKIIGVLKLFVNRAFALLALPCHRELDLYVSYNEIYCGTFNMLILCNVVCQLGHWRIELILTMFYIKPDPLILNIVNILFEIRP